MQNLILTLFFFVLSTQVFSADNTLEDENPPIDPMLEYVSFSVEEEEEEEKEKEEPKPQSPIQDIETTYLRYNDPLSPIQLDTILNHPDSPERLVGVEILIYLFRNAHHGLSTLVRKVAPKNKSLIQKLRSLVWQECKNGNPHAVFAVSETILHHVHRMGIWSRPGPRSEYAKQLWLAFSWVQNHHPHYYRSFDQLDEYYVWFLSQFRPPHNQVRDSFSPLKWVELPDKEEHKYPARTEPLPTLTTNFLLNKFSEIMTAGPQ